MKTKILPFVIVAAVLSSCAGKLDIVKRKYNKGFYVSHTSKKNTVKNPVRTVRSAQHAHPETPAVSGNAVAAERVLPQVHQFAVKPDVQQPLYADASPAIKANGETRATAVKYVARHEFKSLKRELRKEIKEQKARKAASEVDTVVIAILCIFIPPLAVYLFQQKITTDFWVDLILSLLFWLPGIIFAFLVCFGGVSLT